MNKLSVSGCAITLLVLLNAVVSQADFYPGITDDDDASVEFEGSASSRSRRRTSLSSEILPTSPVVCRRRTTSKRYPNPLFIRQRLDPGRDFYLNAKGYAVGLGGAKFYKETSPASVRRVMSVFNGVLQPLNLSGIARPIMIRGEIGIGLQFENAFFEGIPLVDVSRTGFVKVLTLQQLTELPTKLANGRPNYTPINNAYVECKQESQITIAYSNTDDISMLSEAIGNIPAGTGTLISLMPKVVLNTGPSSLSPASDQLEEFTKSDPSLEEKSKKVGLILDQLRQAIENERTQIALMRRARGEKHKAFLKFQEEQRRAKLKEVIRDIELEFQIKVSELQQGRKSGRTPEQQAQADKLQDDLEREKLQKIVRLEEEEVAFHKKFVIADNLQQAKEDAADLENLEKREKQFLEQIKAIQQKLDEEKVEDEELKKRLQQQMEERKQLERQQQKNGQETLRKKEEVQAIIQTQKNGPDKGQAEGQGQGQGPLLEEVTVAQLEQKVKEILEKESALVKGQIKDEAQWTTDGKVASNLLKNDGRPTFGAVNAEITQLQKEINMNEFWKPAEHGKLLESKPAPFLQASVNAYGNIPEKSVPKTVDVTIETTNSKNLNQRPSSQKETIPEFVQNERPERPQDLCKEPKNIKKLIDDMLQQSQSNNSQQKTTTTTTVDASIDALAGNGFSQKLFDEPVIEGIEQLFGKLDGKIDEEFKKSQDSIRYNLWMSYTKWLVTGMKQLLRQKVSESAGEYKDRLDSLLGRFKDLMKRPDDLCQQLEGILDFKDRATTDLKIESANGLSQRPSDLNLNSKPSPQDLPLPVLSDWAKGIDNSTLQEIKTVIDELVKQQKSDEPCLKLADFMRLKSMRPELIKDSVLLINEIYQTAIDLGKFRQNQEPCLKPDEARKITEYLKQMQDGLHLNWKPIGVEQKQSQQSGLSSSSTPDNRLDDEELRKLAQEKAAYEQELREFFPLDKLQMVVEPSNGGINLNVLNILTIGLGKGEKVVVDGVDVIRTDSSEAVSQEVTSIKETGVLDRSKFKAQRKRIVSCVQRSLRNTDHPGKDLKLLNSEGSIFKYTRRGAFTQNHLRSILSTIGPYLPSVNAFTPNTRFAMVSTDRSGILQGGLVEVIARFLEPARLSNVAIKPLVSTSGRTVGLFVGKSIFEAKLFLDGNSIKSSTPRTVLHLHKIVLTGKFFQGIPIYGYEGGPFIDCREEFEGKRYASPSDTKNDGGEGILSLVNLGELL